MVRSQSQGLGGSSWDMGGPSQPLGGLSFRKPKDENPEKIAQCGIIGHRPLWGHCSKRKKRKRRENDSALIVFEASAFLFFVLPLRASKIGGMFIWYADDNV